MCGIAGMYNFNTSDLQPEYFQWCLSTMKNRGPNGQKIWHNSKNYITAFARLAIRDLSFKGDQPMLSEDGNYCISFNGEIYNTDLLKQLLKPYRENFNSTSDTELFLYSLIYLGEKKTLEIADGMFAFAFYALLQNKLVLARDRTGIKPLYIGISVNGIVYSSQYDHIINHSYFKDEAINPNAVASYLFLGYMSEGDGIINKTQLLPHGYYFVIENSTFNSYNYYSYPVSIAGKQGTIDEVLKYSVTSQLVSDVSIGTFMSGGVDSTLVTFFANKKTPLKSFTIGVEDDDTMDETAAAEEFSRLFQTDHYSKYITSSDLVNLLKVNATAFSEPFADYSSLPMLMLSEFARKKVTVALSGDGGDELFWGYNRNIKAMPFIELYKKNNLKRKINLLSGKMNGFSSVDLARHWQHENFIDYYYSSLSITGALKFLPKVCKVKPLVPFFYGQILQLNNQSENTVLNCMSLMRKMEMDIHLQRILLKTDRAGMHYSLEIRVPFLSNAMLDHSASYSYKNCINKNEGKTILKASLAKKTNDKLVYKPKKGFTIPINDLLRNGMQKEVHEKIMNMDKSLISIFNKEKMIALLNDHTKGKNDAGWFIWALYSLSEWSNIHRRKI